MKLPVPHLVVADILRDVDQHFRAPAATVAVWAVDALNALDRIADALERLADAQSPAQAPLTAVGR